MPENTVTSRVQKLLSELPPHILLVAAAKTRSVEEVREAVAAGITAIGENYVQEAIALREAFGDRITCHLIGHLQRNKVKKAVEVFDMIETVDSDRLAREIDKRCGDAGKIMPVLIEINSAREAQKGGVFPENAETLAREIAVLKNIRLQGLMTMGPYGVDPETVRPFFRETRRCFERIAALNIPNVSMNLLSMGMSDSYRIAIEEGANLIRIGTGIFGQRTY